CTFLRILDDWYLSSFPTRRSSDLKDTLRTLGALRPFVGGVFGVATFFALKSGVVALDVGDSKSSYFYILFGFVAGFSERLAQDIDRKSTRLNSSHVKISYAVFCLK